MQAPSLVSLILISSGLVSLPVLDCGAEPGLPNGFTRLEQLPPPRVVAGAEAYPGGQHEVGNIIDGKGQTEYSSNAKGTNTFIEFDLGGPVSVAAFRHLDRNDPATITASELVFVDGSGVVTSTVPVKHVNQRGGVTFLTLPAPVTAQRVTGLGSNYSTVGGAEIAFFRPGKTESLPRATKLEVQAPQLVERAGAGQVRPLKVTVAYPYAEPVEGVVRVAGAEGKVVRFAFGSRSVDLTLPAAGAEQTVKVEVEAGGLTSDLSKTYLFVRRRSRLEAPFFRLGEAAVVDLTRRA